MKKNDDFLSKFGDRVEVIGKDGVMGIMKHTRESINNNYNNYNYQNELFNRGNGRNLTYKHNNGNFRNQEMTNITNILNNTNEYSNYNPSYLSQSYKIKKFNNNIFDNKLNDNFNNNFNIHNNDYSLNMNPFEVNKNRKSISSNNNYRINRQPLIYSCHLNNNKYKIENLPNNIYYNNQEQNKHQIGDNRQNILDNGYKPYTLKDYKKIDNDVNLGKLGHDYDTKQWNEKRIRLKKMSEYGKQLIDGKINKRNSFIKIKMNNINNSAEFSNKVNDNQEQLMKNIKNLKKNYEVKEEIGNENKDYQKQHVNVNYRRRLNNLKNILF